MNPMLTRLRTERESLKTTVDAINDTAAAEERSDLTDVETRNFNEAVESIKTLDARIEELSAIELRNAAAAELATKVNSANVETRAAAIVTREERTYRPDIVERSYFRDVMNFGRDAGATERLQRHNHEYEVETRSVNTGAISGFAPVQYLTDRYAALARASRPTANLITNVGAPTADTFIIPKVTTGASVAFQANESDALSTTDQVVSNITVATQTIGGTSKFTRQTIDLGQLPDNFIFDDLARAHATAMEVFVLNGSVTNAKGILQTSSIGTTNYVDTTPTLPELYSSIASAVNSIHTNVFAQPTVIITDPFVANWAKSRSDTSGRPLVPPVAPMNAGGSFGSLGAEGVTFELYGLPVCVSSSVPAPSNVHKIIVMRTVDSMIWEGPVQAEVFPDQGATTLEVVFRLFSYTAQTHARQPKNINVISGTGTDSTANLAF